MRSHQVPADLRQDYLVFSSDNHLFALPTTDIIRAIRVVALTPVPEAPPLLRGMLNLAGTMIPVVDMNLRLKNSLRPISLDNRIIIIESGRLIGLLVEFILDVHILSIEAHHSAETIYPDLANYMTGMAQLESEAVILLNPETMFNETALEQAQITAHLDD